MHLYMAIEYVRELEEGCRMPNFNCVDNVGNTVNHGDLAHTQIRSGHGIITQMGSTVLSGNTENLSMKEVSTKV